MLVKSGAYDTIRTQSNGFVFVSELSCDLCLTLISSGMCSDAQTRAIPIICVETRVLFKLGFASTRDVCGSAHDTSTK